MEDLILKLSDMGLDSCWLTFHDSEHVKAALEIDSEMDVVAMAAFGYGAKTSKRLRWNVLSMSNVDANAQRQYFQPKLSVRNLVHLNAWGNHTGAEEHIGFYDDMLWEAFYAASLAPSYLNRQPYGFLIHDGRITLVQKPDMGQKVDGFTDDIIATGIWTNEAWGEYTACIEVATDNCILIGLTDGRSFVVSRRDNEETQKVFMELQTYIQ
jgi:nitroreductase